ncbi:MAG: hypothetical protein QOJ52_4442 [Acidimicrobiaceae bacterium]|nr:hypothetical protein [Acidimicrobiaceae bacterium]
MPPTPKLLTAAAAPLLVALLVAVAPAVGATTAKPKTKTTTITSRHLWATVDTCNTAAHPRVIGIRGSMPGTGLKTETMFMRFQVEYQDGADWKPIPAADSGFFKVGSATFKARQSGRYFTIRAVPGTAYVLRGVVSFQWRKRGHAVLRAMEVTTAGHLATAGADPAGYSAAACSLPAG